MNLGPGIVGDTLHSAAARVNDAKMPTHNVSLRQRPTGRSE